MKRYRIKGYNKWTGRRVTIEVDATTRKHAKRVACEQITRPHIVEVTRGK